MKLLFDLTIQDPNQTWLQLKTNNSPKILKIRHRLEDLWQTFEPFADANFRQEFAKHPHQRFWEMLVCAHLLKSGKNVAPKNARVQKGPDILVKDPNVFIWIEAVTPTAGKTNTVPVLQVDDNVHTVPDDPLLLRFVQALEEKRQKFRKYLKDGIVAADDLRIVAVNAGDQGGSGIFSNVFDPAVYPPRAKTWGGYERTWGSPCKIEKSNGSIVPASIFTSADSQGITGAIFSPSSMGNLVGSDTEFHYFPNPNSDTRLPAGWLQWTREHIMSDQPALIELEHGREIAKVVGQFPLTDQ